MTNQNLDVLGNLLRDKLAEQPIVKKYSNTATTAVGAIIGLLWAVIASGVELPQTVVVSVLGLISVLTVVGVVFTPNSITAKQIEEIEDYVGQHRADG